LEFIASLLKLTVNVMCFIFAHRSFAAHHSLTSSSHSVNGDIAIQWKWSKFGPTTDYDKTLHLDYVHETNTYPQMCANRC